MFGFQEIQMHKQFTSMLGERRSKIEREKAEIPKCQSLRTAIINYIISWKYEKRDFYTEDRACR